LESIDEAFLPGLGIHRIPTPVPFLEAGGPANVYALEDEGEGFTLFDCAIGTEDGLQALREGLAARGLDAKKLNRILISHGHTDHYGNAQTLAEESGAPVFVHANDLEKISGEGRLYRQLEKSWSYFQRLGVPDATLQAMLETGRRHRSYARPVDRHRVHLFEPGQRFSFRHFEAEVLHMPGHTPGLVCLWLAHERVLLADDHVLAKVSPNPLLDLTLGEGETKFKALVAYYESARRVQAMDIACVLPGHGEAFRGHQALLESLFAFYAARQERLLKRLEKGPQTVYELIPAVFPRVDISRLYLMLSEVLGNLEVLESQGRIVRVEGDDAQRWSAAAPPVTRS
jgi:glyoxylase-like metal-dependent hydrolase (beta-lactamase superfamily II)